MRGNRLTGFQVYEIEFIGNENRNVNVGKMVLTSSFFAGTKDMNKRRFSKDLADWIRALTSADMWLKLSH